LNNYQKKINRQGFSSSEGIREVVDHSTPEHSEEFYTGRRGEEAASNKPISSFSSPLSLAVEDPPRKNLPSSYLDLYAKSPNSLLIGSERELQKADFCPNCGNPNKKILHFSQNSCGQWAKVGICQNCGKRYVKILYCGKEWCWNCQEKLHKRRQARLLPKVYTMERAGYFVFTIPEEHREFYKEKENLSKLRSYLRDKFHRTFLDLKAITRWHWFGDKNLTKYNPHLNILVADIQRLDRAVLRMLKEDYKRYLERETGISLSDKKIDVYYQFLTDQVEILHKVKYITRPTFLVYQKELAQKLKGYRNGTVWGRFEELDPEVMERLAIWKESHCENKDALFLANSLCPHCLKSISWTEGLYSSGIASYGEEIAEGYYSLNFWPRAGPVKLPERWEIHKARDKSFAPGRMFADI